MFLGPSAYLTCASSYIIYSILFVDGASLRIFLNGGFAWERLISHARYIQSWRQLRQRSGAQMEICNAGNPLSRPSKMGRIAVRAKRLWQTRWVCHPPLRALVDDLAAIAILLSALPSLRAGQSMRRGGRASSRAVLVHASSPQPTSSAGDARGGARHGVPLPRLRLRSVCAAPRPRHSRAALMITRF